MEELNIVTWRWGNKYSGDYVTALKNSLKRHIKQKFTFGVFKPQEEDEHLTKIPGCFARLRMFDPEWQKRNRLFGRIVCIDLDSVITGELDQLFDRMEEFVILHGGNLSNPCPYNGSLWMLRAGSRPDVWKDFSVENATKAGYWEKGFPDDQGWFAHKIPEAAGWEVGKNGVYCFKKPGWPEGDDLPKGARAVFFPGWRDPSKFTHLKWVKENWMDLLK